MKLIILCMLGSLILFACNQDKRKESGEPTRDTTKVSVGLPDEKNKSMISGDDLSNLTPLSDDELKALLPAEIMGVPHTDDDINSAIGAKSIVTEYRVNDTTRLELVIIDCAGPGGAGVYNMQYIAMLGLSEDNDEEYTRTVDLQGTKAFENCSKTRMDCSFTWFVKRYLISLNGNLPAPQLREIAESLRIGR